MFVIWSVKTNSWVGGSSSPYTSDLKDAKRFERDKAIAFCKSRFGGMSNNPAALPIDEALLAEVSGK